MLSIKTWRDPYNAGFSPTTPTVVEFKEGLTVLVGCNGAGKSTLLQNIKEVAQENKIPCHLYDNLKDGGATSVLGLVLSGLTEYEGDDIGLGISMCNSSEGENIRANIARQSSKYKKFIGTGKFDTRSTRIAEAFAKYNGKVSEEIVDNRRIFLYDATDSGMSIDVVCEIRQMFTDMMAEAEAEGIELYIIISANEYEMCRNADCFDVNAGKYLTFTDYNNYRQFIIKSRIRKDKRIARQAIWLEKQKKHETDLLKKEKASLNKELENLKARNASKWKIEDVERAIKRLCYHAEYLTRQEAEEVLA